MSGDVAGRTTIDHEYASEASFLDSRKHFEKSVKTVVSLRGTIVYPDKDFVSFLQMNSASVVRLSACTQCTLNAS
jgi:hypothetical protein